MEDWIETTLSGDGSPKVVTFQGIVNSIFFNSFFFWAFIPHLASFRNYTLHFSTEIFRDRSKVNFYIVGYCVFSWQRFNATKMLELIRGKRLVFVGDSINRNQWESMLCMLLGAIKDPKRVYESRGRKITKEKGNYSFRFLVILQNLTSFL